MRPRGCTWAELGVTLKAMQVAFPERFGTATWLRLSTIVALVFWLLVSAWALAEGLLRGSAIPGHLYVALAFFDFLFVVTTLYYHHRQIVVDEDGVTVLGALSFAYYTWGDILRVEPEGGGLPGWQVLTRRGRFGFSPIELPGHARLRRLLERYRMRPVNAPNSLPAPAAGSAPAAAMLRRRFRRRMQRLRVQ